MQIQASSNVVGGIYSLVEVVLSVLLLHFLRTIFEWHNVKTIYDERKPLRLVETRLSLFSDPGLAPRWLARVTVLILIAVVSLTSAGGFGIAGFTRESYEEVRVKSKLVPAGNGETIDFRKHVSADGGRVSGTVLLLMHHTCVHVDTKRLALYGSFSDMEDVNTIKWPAQQGRLNTTCVMEDAGFEDEVVFEQALRGTKSTTGTECMLPRDVVLPKKQITQLVIEPQPEILDCPFKIIDAWCSNFIDWRCAGNVKYADGYSTILFFIGPSGGIQGTVAQIGIQLYDEPFTPEVLKSVAFLADMNIHSSATSLIRMVSLSVETNGFVRKFGGNKNVTNVNVPLIAATLGTTIVTTLFIGCAALVGWFRFIVKPGRRDYNKFTSGMDALSCAAVEVLKEGECRFRHSGAISVGVEGGVAGPVPDTLDVEQRNTSPERPAISPSP